MLKTLFLSYSLKNTYRVNSILYAIKQLPILKRLLPDSVYSILGLKVFANVLTAIWELLSVFLGKFLYLGLMVILPCTFWPELPTDELILHILLPLTILGAFTNTYLFNPTRDKYYAVILLRMNARSYALANYGYDLLKYLIGMLAAILVFGLTGGLPLWLCLLFPFFAAGCKLLVVSLSLMDYEKKKTVTNENRLGKLAWLIMGLLVVLSYAPPAAGFLLPLPIAAAVMILGVLAGLTALHRLLTFREFRGMYQQLLPQAVNIQTNAAKAIKERTEKYISTDASFSSKKDGFEFLNELFIRRHQKILWKSSKRISLGALVVAAAAILLLLVFPEVKESVNSALLVYLPYFTFIMYLINRGTGFTQALFMNCDHSLLTYSFYKKPEMVLHLFRIRLLEIMKINLLPAVIIGSALPILLYLSGGTDNPLNYVVLLVSILCMSMFFSVHYLTIYYLLQPYNAGTEMKSGTYRLVLTVTYFVCFFRMQQRIPILLFGALAILFCVLYCIVACILVYKFAPRTFRIRP